VLLFFDIVNMFNSVSWKSSWHELEQTMPLLLPSFDMKCWNANLCWYKQLNGSWANFEMNDRFPQGDTSSSFLSCFTLQAIINTLHRDLINKLSWVLHYHHTLYKIKSTFCTTYWSIYWWPFMSGSSRG
jgi:hypothetical protein